MTRVIGYIRVSTEGQADGGVSLDAQRAKLEAYALALDLELIAIEVDAGLSAKSLARPGLQSALAALDRGAADALLIPKLDRLTRSVRDLGYLVDAYFAARFSLISVADSIDTRTAAGRLVLHVLGAVSQWEREAIGERTADAMQHLRAQGIPLGTPAYGWQRTAETDDDGRRLLAHCRDELATARRIVAARQAGASWREIADGLNSDGITAKRGGAWHANAVRRVALRHGARA
jgi:DNA invertase Pin-like site-specific DNA recombinase